MTRKPLQSVTKKTADKAAKAASVAQALAPSGAASEYDEGEVFDTISVNLPLDLIDLCRDLAEARVRVARAERRKAAREGRKAPEARKSASAVIREALEAHKDKMEAELQALDGQRS